MASFIIFNAAIYSALTIESVTMGCFFNNLTTNVEGKATNRVVTVDIYGPIRVCLADQGYAISVSTQAQ